jgi:glycosyltransferase involved in cell wall biosynthesis
MSRVTIIIPSFDQEEYLGEAIESALMQTVPCEIVVIDDGSTDGSLALARSYEPRGVKVISQVNKGLASARNTGIMNASGEYILPLDADDVLLPHCVERLLAKADETGAEVVGPSLQEFGISDAVIILHPEPTLAHFRLGNHLGYFSLIKKSALLEIGGYSPKMVEGFEDYHLWFNLLCRGKRIVTVPDVLVKYRTKKESMYTKADKVRPKLMTQIFNDFPEAVPEEITTL